MRPLQFSVDSALDEFVRDVLGALPEVLSGLAFLLVAGIVVKLLVTLVNTALKRLLPGESPVYRSFIGAVVAAFLWFGVLLSFLAIVGLDEIAASLGTAAGFLALGIAYALSNMIADVVAGVYLLRDPDFMPGDTVDVGGTVGVVEAIELRKTRLDVDGDTVVRANADIEKKWTKLADDVPAHRATDA